MDLNALIDFSVPYYATKDIMHNIRHIELVVKAAEYIIHAGKYSIDHDSLLAAAYFHGFIHSNEEDARNWLSSHSFSLARVEKTIQSALESHATAQPKNLEGMILHDAHLIEGGKVYMVTKCLVTGSLRGQTLAETMDYIEANILDKRQCFLKESIPLFDEANQFTKDFLLHLKTGIS